jgi:Helicase conserved C-terminal domain
LSPVVAIRMQRVAVFGTAPAVFGLCAVGFCAVGPGQAGLGVGKGRRGREGAAETEGRVRLGRKCLVLLSDLLFAANLLVQVGSAFKVTAQYEDWREGAPAQQWSKLAWTWFQLPHSPTVRTTPAVRVLMASAASRVEDGVRVWQFTAASVRRASAHGWTGESLPATLDELTRQNVPWALRALLGERGRGRVQVREVGCCVIAEADVITEVVRLPGFVELAPTVAAGASSGPCGSGGAGSGGLSDLNAEEPSAARIVRMLNRKLPEEAVMLPAGAIDDKSDVRVDYVDKKGDSEQRIITPLRWAGPFLWVWCHLRDAERKFEVARIRSVSPV